MVRRKISNNKPRKNKTANKRTNKLGRLVGWLFAPIFWLWRLFAKLLIRGAIVGGLIFAAYVGYLATTLPEAKELIGLGPQGGVMFLDRNGERIVSYGPREGEALLARHASPYLIQAVLATEDHRYYSHFGFDPIGIARAMTINIKAGELRQGGSTITQQTAKNLFLSNKRSLMRKFKELCYALALEIRYSKEEILTLYINRVYLGADAYGFETAARRYFGKSAHDVSLAEAALLAGLLKAPSRYAPHRHLERARGRAKTVLSLMKRYGYIDEAEYSLTIKNPAVLTDSVMSSSGRYFADWATERVPEWLRTTGEELVVSTTYDPEIQRVAQEALQRVVSEKVYPGSTVQVAVVVMSYDGAVRAMIGGRSYAESQFNRAAHAWRQPGSAFKPAVYAVAFEAGLTPESKIIDAPITIGNWSPRNYDRQYRGPITLTQGLAHSVNSVAVRVAEYAGRQKLVDMAQRLGFSRYQRPDPANALGASEGTLLQLVALYAQIANGGVEVQARALDDISVFGATSPLYVAVDENRSQVLTSEHAGWLIHMLRVVVEEGTGRRAFLPGRPMAGKTGTSQKARDAWFVGFTGQYVTGVWMGKDDNTPLKGVSGSGLPAEIWREIMQGIHKDLPVVALNEDLTFKLPVYSQEPARTRSKSADSDIAPGIGQLVDKIINFLGF